MYLLPISYYVSATPFKVHVSFNIPIFEGQIGADPIDKWLDLLEGYFSVHDFPVRKRLPFHFSKSPPTSRTSGKPTVRRRMKENPHYF